MAAIASNRDIMEIIKNASEQIPMYIRKPNSARLSLSFQRGFDYGHGTKLEKEAAGHTFNKKTHSGYENSLNS